MDTVSRAVTACLRSVSILVVCGAAHGAPYPIDPLASFPVTAFGAVGDNQTLCTDAFELAIACAFNTTTNGTHPTAWVIVPPGVYLTGKVSLKSHVYLVLEPQGVIQGSAAVSDYGDDWDYWHVVQGVGITDSGVLAPQHVVDHIGGGLIKGPMWQMIESFPPENFSRGFKQKPWRCPDEGGCGDGRPKNLAFIDSSEITVQGVSLVDSSDWTQLFRRCHNVLEDHVFVEGDLHWGNNDGLDVESGSNLIFSNSIFRTGDDCLAFRSGNCNPLRTPWPLKPPGFQIEPLTNVRVSNMSLTSSSAAIKVEALFQVNHGNLSNLKFDNIRITQSNRGIGVWQRDGNGTLTDVSFSNVNIETHRVPMAEFWGSGEPLVVTSIPSPCVPSSGHPIFDLKGISRVSFQNISARSEGGALFASRGQNNRGQLSQIVLDRVNITISKGGSLAPQHDYRPVEDKCTAEIVPALVDGIFVENVASIQLRGVTVGFNGQKQPGWSMQCLNATGATHVVGALKRCDNSSKQNNTRVVY